MCAVDLDALRVVIVGFKRPASLARLLASLMAANYSSHHPPSISVHLELDQPSNHTLDREMDAVAGSLRSWPYGEVRVRRRRSHAGLRDNVLGAWLPRADETVPAVFLEDDIELSPLWWLWVQASLRRYAHLACTASEQGTGRRQLIGISLFTPDDMNEPYLNRGGAATCPWQSAHARSRVPRSASAVAFAQPCSWGALYLPGAWRDFVRQADSLRRLASVPSIPCPPSGDVGGPGGVIPGASECKQVSANRWGRSSWKRLLLLHMMAQGLFMVYPNLPGRTSFSTNHVEPGTHVNHAALHGQRTRHRVPLVTRGACDRWRMACERDAFELPEPAQLGLWDFYCAEQPSIERDGSASALQGAGEPLRALLPPPAEDVPLEPAEAFDEYVVGSTGELELQGSTSGPARPHDRTHAAGGSTAHRVPVADEL